MRLALLYALDTALLLTGVAIITSVALKFVTLSVLAKLIIGVAALLYRESIIVPLRKAYTVTGDDK